MITRSAKLAFVSAVVVALGSLASAQSYSATLEGAQEVPPVPTPATGTGTFTLDASKILSYSISYSGLTSSETGAHIHGPAAPGSNAGVVFGLPPGSPKVGSVGPLSPAQEADLNAGLYYVNIHTSFYPGGEIRGQITADVVSNDSTAWGRIKSLYERR